MIKAAVLGFRVQALFAALVLYALLGTPTPDHLRLTELVLGALLIMAAGPAPALRVFGIGKPVPPALVPGQALLLYGLSVPLIAGALHGNEALPLLRDVIPFLFFLLPLFCFENSASPGGRRALIAGAALMGLAFAVRDMGRMMGDFSFLAPVAADPLSYLANAPTVLFTALLLTGCAGRLIWQGRGLRDFMIAALFLLLAILPFTVMALTMQRASLGLAALVMVIWLGGAFLARPRAALRLLVPLALLAIPLLPFLQELTVLLLAKTEAVGLNSRAEEIAAIWRAVAGNPLTLLFGLGWGAEFSSPAVGGLSVNFAHSLPAAMLLKTGLAGVLLTILYLVSFIAPLLRLMRRDLVLALALAAPILIDCFLYAAYKSLDFGVVLLLLAVAGRAVEERA